MPRIPLFLSREGVILPGLKRIIPVPQPQPGLNFSAGPDGGKQWRVLAVAGTFTSSAQVANRNVGIAFLRGQDVIWDTLQQFNQPASSTDSIRASVAGNAGTLASDNSRYQTGIPQLWLPTGCTVTSLAANIQTLDQWSQIVLYVEEAWIDDADMTDVLDTLLPLSNLARGGN